MFNGTRADMLIGNMAASLNRLRLIAKREFLSYLRTPGFWLSLMIGPIAAGFGAMAPAMMHQAAPTPVLTLIDLSGTGATPTIAAALDGPKPLAILVRPPAAAATATSPAEAGRALRRYLSGDPPAGGPRLDAAAILSGTPQTIVVDFWSRDINDPDLRHAVHDAVAQAMQQARLRAAGLPAQLVAQFSAAAPVVHSYSPRAAGGQVSMKDRLPSLLGLGLAFVLFFAIFTGAGILLNSVIEEKSSRILEVLLSSATVPELLGGKILGVAGVSAFIIAGWGAMGLLALHRAAPAMVAQVGAALMTHGLVIWFALFFMLGYIMYASVFAAIGAFCETVREAQTLLGPIMILITLPVMFLTVALEHPDAPLIVALSWVPPFTPFLMTARLAAGPPLWQVLGALILMAATTAAVVWLCARAFRAGALSTGKLDLKRLAAGLLGRAR
jgi:ABC-2 type transport system permease protein